MSQKTAPATASGYQPGHLPPNETDVRAAGAYQFPHANRRAFAQTDARDTEPTPTVLYRTEIARLQIEVAALHQRVEWERDRRLTEVDHYEQLLSQRARDRRDRDDEDSGSILSTLLEALSSGRSG